MRCAICAICAICENNLKNQETCNPHWKRSNNVFALIVKMFILFCFVLTEQQTLICCFHSANLHIDIIGYQWQLKLCGKKNKIIHIHCWNYQDCKILQRTRDNCSHWCNMTTCFFLTHLETRKRFKKIDKYIFPLIQQ